jgi:predicted transposase/invertase (TIGR01784 family)
MAYALNGKYINLLTDFGFKRVFGTEPNKQLLIDFLNTLLPDDRRIEDLTFRNSEHVGNTPVDRKAIFDIYCQGCNGDRFIVEIQKAKQNYFKDRSVYYSTFPIQEQALQGEWNYKLTPVYAIGILDFVFDDHKNSSTFIHTVELKDQDCQVFYDKLRFIYVELPKFQKTLPQLSSHQDKWLFLLKHLASLSDRPLALQEEIFNNLFDVAEIANFSTLEQYSYHDSLKYYRDLNNVVDTSRQEGLEEGLQQGIEQGIQTGIEQGLRAGLEQGIQQGMERGIEQERLSRLERQRSLVVRLLERMLGVVLSESVQENIQPLSLEQLDRLNEALLTFGTLDDLNAWLDQNPGG